MNTFFARSLTILVLSLTAANADASELSEVQLDNGQTLVAQLDSRSTDEVLYLRFEGVSTVLTKRVPCERVVSIQPVAEATTVFRTASYTKVTAAPTMAQLADQALFGE